MQECIEDGQLSYSNSKYFVYNFDLSTGKRISNETLFKSKRCSKKDIDEMLKKEIEKFEYITCFEGTEYEEQLKKSLNAYENALSSNTIQYSLNCNDGISAFLKLETVGYYEQSESEIELNLYK